MYLSQKIERDAIFVEPISQEKPLNGPLMITADSTRKAWSKSIDTSTWQTYTNQEYGFEFKYPSEYHLVTSGKEESWPHAIVLLECANMLCQSYELAVELKESNRIQEDEFKHVYEGKATEDGYVMLTNQGNKEIIYQVISTFTSL